MNGENSIPEGVKLSGNDISDKYGYFGKAAPWNVDGVNMKGGAGQMNTVFSWGTLKEFGIISNLGRVKI